MVVLSRKAESKILSPQVIINKCIENREMIQNWSFEERMFMTSIC